MKIGIIGAGSMGSALGLRWARAGHEVLFGSRDLNKARALATRGTASARAGSFDDAAVFGDVVLYTVRQELPSSVLRRPETLAGRVLIDCNNSDILGLDIPNPDHSARVRFVPPIPSHAERLAADVPGARVVKAFNTVPATVIALDFELIAPHSVSVFLCSDDPGARGIVKTLAEELGFVGVDSGPLERAQLVESVADFIRLQILEMGRGPFATISMHVIETARQEGAA